MKQVRSKIKYIFYNVTLPVAVNINNGKIILYSKYSHLFYYILTNIHSDRGFLDINFKQM